MEDAVEEGTGVWSQGGNSGITRNTAAGMCLGLLIWSAREAKVLCVGDGCFGCGKCCCGLRWGDRRDRKWGTLGVRGGSPKQD